MRFVRTIYRFRAKGCCFPASLARYRLPERSPDHTTPPQQLNNHQHQPTANLSKITIKLYATGCFVHRRYMVRELYTDPESAAKIPESPSVKLF